MTMRERLKVHRQIERENRRKLKEWMETHELNERIAADEILWFINEGIIA